MMTGKKNDSNKPRAELLPPKAMLEVARTLGHGAKKYGDENWREVEQYRYIGAALRHVLYYMAGEHYDKESELHALSHAVASLMFVIEQDLEPFVQAE